MQWCEEDYYVSYYCAEIINSWTNLMFIYLSFRGVKSCWKHGHDTVFTVAYLGYFLVGFGSFMFHATLQYPWQLVDELNMIYTTCLMAYASLSYARPVGVQILLGIFLIVLCLGITLYYHHIQDPTFHQNVYAAMTVFIVFRSAYSMESTLRPYFRRSTEQHRLEKKGQKLPVPTKAENDYENGRDREILKNMWILVAYGVTIFLSGFAIWGVDNVYCSSLRRWRRQIGMPWGFFLAGHGWWHLMTGIGAYCYIVWGIHLRHVLNGDQDKYQMVWPNLWTLPEIVRVESKNEGATDVSVNGVAVNGYSKKTK